MGNELSQDLENLSGNSFTAERGINMRNAGLPEFVHPFYKLMDDALDQLLIELEDRDTNIVTDEKVSLWIADIDLLLTAPAYMTYIYYDDKPISQEVLNLVSSKGFSVWKHQQNIITAIFKQTDRIEACSHNALNLMATGFYQIIDL